MDRKLREKIFNIGLFAGIPAADPDYLVPAVRAVVAGGMCGVVLSWNKHLGPTVEQIHREFPQLLIGIQGPYGHSCRLFASGAHFVADTAAVPAKVQVPFLLRKGNDLIDKESVLAQCSNKIVFVSDMKKQRWEDIALRAHQSVTQMLGFELRHVGINHPDAQQANQTAGVFEKLFGFNKQDKGGAYFEKNVLRYTRTYCYRYQPCRPRRVVLGTARSQIQLEKCRLQPR